MAALHMFLALFAIVCASANELKFTDIPAPNEISHKFVGFTDYSINGVPRKTQFRRLLESGKNYPSFEAGKIWTAGTVLDKYGMVITEAEHPEANPAMARDYDRTSFIEKFGKLWAITQQEDAFGNYFLTLLSQSNTGVLTVTKGKSLNVGLVNGAIWPCSGSTSPWNTHLGTEEITPEAKNYPPASAIGVFERQAIVNRLNSWSEVNPYWYGWIVEIAITKPDGSYAIAKRYSAGRTAHEIMTCLKDRRTCIAVDDTNGGVVNLFVADKKGDLRSGKLYAALPLQLNAADGGSFSIKWVSVNPTGESVHENLIKDAVSGATYADAKVKFADLFDVAVVLPNVTNPDLSLLPAGFKQVKTTSTNYEWLKLKVGMGALASRMETRRMSAYMGACVEFTRAEGFAYDPVRNVGYLAMTAIHRDMLDNVGTYDLGGVNAIRLPYNQGGAVYRLVLGNVRGVSTMAPIAMKAVITSFGYNSSLVNNSIPLNAIASPDNVDIMVKYNKLLIGEDCGNQHTNNVFWSLDLNTGELNRLGYTSYNAEVTSPYYFPNFGKFSYITATQQHPNVEDEPCMVGYWVLPKEK